jgi:hypothetical protein
VLALPFTIIHTPKVAVGQSRCKKQLVVSRTASITETVKMTATDQIATQNYFVLSETDLNKSPTLMHNYDKDLQPAS